MKNKNDVINKLFTGDCLDILRSIDSEIYTCCIVDPPYGLSDHSDIHDVIRTWMNGEVYRHNKKGFMGAEWDGFMPGPEVWREVLRVLKPGGHILSLSGTRGYDLMTLAIRLAGAEIRDKITFFSEIFEGTNWLTGQGFPKSLSIGKAMRKAGINEEIAKPWDGNGTCLKPAVEPIIEVGKSTDDVKAQPLPIDVPFLYTPKVSTKERNYGCKNLFWLKNGTSYVSINGTEHSRLFAENETHKDDPDYKKHDLAEGNIHPCCKPIELSRYLVKLCKQPSDNLILDPFCGSGSTAIGCILEGCDFTMIEREPNYCKIADSRIRYFKCLGKQGLR